MAAKHFTVRRIIRKKYEAKETWVVDFHKSFAGRRLRRFAESEPDAYRLGDETVEKIRAKGIEGLKAETGTPMQGACEQFKKRYAGKSKSHREKVELVTRMLWKKFDFLDVAPADLDKWFRGLAVSETTKGTYYRYLRMFFRWAKKMEYLRRDPSEALDAPKSAVGRNILTPAQMREVLKIECDGWMRACLLLAGFGGLRTAELLRMTWEDIDTKAGQIHVRPGVMKDSGGFDQRIVDFTGPLTRRAKHLKGKGKLVPVAGETLHERRRKIGEKAGLGESWPDNCLRHSFATYHLGKTGNPALTAFQMGHTSPSMVQRVYAVPAKRAAWEEWWSL